MARARVSHGASTYNFAQQLWRPSSLLPPSPMQQHMSSPPPSSSLSRPGNTGSRALSLVWVEQRLPCYLLPDAPSRWHPNSPSTFPTSSRCHCCARAMCSAKCRGRRVVAAPSTLTGWSLFCAAPNRAVETRASGRRRALPVR
uniref:Uncharacterized protein n=2 Tax=Zea mays TaxID=4577 RepID=A0A804PUJ5_MAIZE